MSELFEYNYGGKKLHGRPMNVLTASGPFTLDDSLKFEPFDCMMDTMDERAPDLLILVFTLDS